MAAPICPVFALCLAGAVIFLAESAVLTRPGTNTTGLDRSDVNATGFILLPSGAENEIDLCGSSKRAGSCPATCFRPDPVCGVDGVTYWCGCGDAACAGIKVAKLGFCEVEKGGAGPQAMLLIHIVWLIVVGFSVIFGVF